MAPLIAAAIKLLPLIPSIRGLWSKAEDPVTKLELATQIVSTAKAAITGAELVPRENPEEFAVQFATNPGARDSFKNLAAEREQDWRKLVLKDIQHAREVSGKNHTQLIEAMAAKVMKENVWFVVLLIIGQIACMVYFSENGVLLALVSNVIGVVVGQLLGERMQILSYLFGATIVKDKKDEGQST
jgi:uncharacterized membrane protein YeaQ/YmgE (transglycosylase-associated protein family)